jgi:hypothetical protein
LKILYILEINSAFVTSDVFEKNTTKYNIMGELQRDFFILLYCIIMNVVFVILYLLKHFKVKLIVPSNNRFSSVIL